MKSIFDADARQEVIMRMALLTDQSEPLWGKMSVAQMVKHCATCEAYYHGNTMVKRSQLGRLVGRMALKSILKNEASGLQKNAPTSPQFRVSDSNLDFGREREHWKRLIQQYADYKEDYFMHWFFGPMSKAQLGQFVYKHSDHHLKQFGV